jgi:hypothetical protein
MFKNGHFDILFTVVMAQADIRRQKLFLMARSNGVPLFAFSGFTSIEGHPCKQTAQSPGHPANAFCIRLGSTNSMNTKLDRLHWGDADLFSVIDPVQLNFIRNYLHYILWIADAITLFPDLSRIIFCDGQQMSESIFS